MIVVDSSVWISAFANHIYPETERLRTLAANEVILVGDVVMMEVLRGARSDRLARQMEQQLKSFVMVHMMSPDLAIQAARFYRQLRGRGVTIRSSIDLIIGTYCIVHGHALLQRDRDFAPMQQYLGLRLA